MVITLLVVIAFSFNLDAQFSTNSLYSFYGIGDIEPSGNIRTTAMGGTAYAMKSENHINNLNPASVSEFDSTTFIFTSGVHGYVTALQSGSQSAMAHDFNFNHLAFGFPVTKWWGSAVGLVPFSNVGYDISIKMPVEGSPTEIEKQFTGTGGITQFYFINSFHFIKQLSVGINVSYLMGTVRQTESSRLAAFDYPDITTIKTKYYRNFFYDFGLQFSQDIGKDHLAIGITCSPPQKLKIRHNVEIVIPSIDTVRNETDDNEKFSVPISIGAGISYNFHSILELAFDYGFTKWSNSEVTFRRARLTDSYHYNFGLEFIPPEKLSRNYFRIVRYRIGAYYENTYIEMKGNPIRDQGISLGAGFPIGRQRSSLDLAFNIGRLGLAENGLIQKTYASVKLGFNFQDYWFIKRRFD